MMKRTAAMLLMICLLLTAISLPAYAEDAPVFSTAAELMDCIGGECAPALAEEIRFFYTEELDWVFRDPEPMEAVLYNAGILHWRQYQNAETREVRLTEIEYYPGFEIAQRRKAGETHLLDEEQAALLAEAEKIVSGVMETAESEYEIARGLHDELVRRVTYESSEMYFGDSRDTAVGALLNGLAECDGYADAYYLLCSIAGLQAGYQHGLSADGDGWIGHLWNVVCVDGLWYHTDVTWDDIGWDSYPGLCTYRYFMAGCAEMLENHGWDDALVNRPLAEENREDLFFYTRSGACFETLKDAASYIAAQKKGPEEQFVHVMVKGTQEGATLNDLLARSGMKGGWSVYSYPMGEDVCYDILIAG